MEIVDLTSVYTRLGFNMEMFTSKNKEDLSDELRNLNREKDERIKRKVLMGRLYELWKNEDLKTKKPIYNIFLDGRKKFYEEDIF